MSYQFTLSDIGLKLIKAYEGFRPNAKRLSSDMHVIGFGHPVKDRERGPIDEAQAEELLKSDLKPIEELVNNQVFASMTQSQFDALCSLAFSIGERAFLSSNVLQSLNEGHIIDAANGFDDWRMGRVGDKVFIVDALVRRRTAEKALFLRPVQRTARAPRLELSVSRDVSALSSTSSTSNLAYDTQTDKNEANILSLDNEIERDESWQAPPRRQAFARRDTILTETIDPNEDDLVAETHSDMIDSDIEDNPFYPDRSQPVSVLERRREEELETLKSYQLQDNGALTPITTSEDEDNNILELHSDETRLPEELTDTDTTASNPNSSSTARSPIAQAAAAVSERLDALIDTQTDLDTSDIPDSLIALDFQNEERREQIDQTNIDLDTDNVVPFNRVDDAPPPDVIIDELQADDALRQKLYDTDRYVQYAKPDGPQNNIWAFLTLTLVGLVAFVTGFLINMKGSANILGENGPFLSVAAMLIGGLLSIVGLYYLFKILVLRR